MQQSQFLVLLLNSPKCAENCRKWYLPSLSLDGLDQSIVISNDLGCL